MLVILTPNIADFSKLFTQGALSPDFQVVAHKSTIAQQTESSSLLSTSQNRVSIVPDFRIGYTLFVVLPETLDPSGAFVSIAHVVSPCPLYTSGHVVPVTISHRF